jgi:hypothetical protein
MTETLGQVVQDDDVDDKKGQRKNDANRWEDERG